MTTIDQAEPESLGTFGRIDDPERLKPLDDPPIPFTMLGYPRHADAEGNRVPREFTFHVRPMPGFGPIFNVIRKVSDRGTIPENIAAQFLFDALVPEDQEPFMEVMRDGNYEFDAEIIGQFAEALAVRYNLRPSPSRSERRSGPRPIGTTSTVEPSAPASDSSTSQPVTPSTSSTP